MIRDIQAIWLSEDDTIQKFFEQFEYLSSREIILEEEKKKSSTSLNKIKKLNLK